MKILITGASGFVGASLCSRLIQEGHSIYGLSSQKLQEAPQGFAGYYQQDLAKPFHLEDSFDIAIHLAAYNVTHVGDKSGDLYTSVNVQGTRHLLEALKAKRLIYLSTAKSYKNDGVALTENSVLAPGNAYEVSKLQAEELCQSLFKDEGLVIFRSVNIIGPGQALKAVLPVFFEKARQNQSLDVFVPVDTVVQFVYVEDIVDAFVAVINNPKAQGIFNIACEQTLTIDELARRVIALTHSSSNIHYRDGSLKGVFAPVICKKAQDQLGWKAKTNIETVLKKYMESYAKSKI